MNNREIQKTFSDLNSKIVSINERLRKSDSKLNVREIVECWCEFGEAMNMLRRFYHEFGFPEMNGGIVLSKLWMTDALATACRLEIRDMEHLVSFDENKFLENDVIGDLFYEIASCCCSGDYDIPINSNVATIKRELLCGLMEVAYDYWCGTKIDDNYYYENLEHFNKLQEYYELYKEYVGIQCKNYRCNEEKELVCVYEGPQFGNEIVGVFDYIDKGYDRFKEKPRKLEKK